MSVDPQSPLSPGSGQGVDSSPSASQPFAPDASSTPPARQSGGLPGGTYLAIVACVGVFLGLTAEPHPISWDAFAHFGFLPGEAIWNGGYWALFTSAFVHVELWHVAFNVYWLWKLGVVLERAIGSWWYFAFLLGAAFVSSAAQLAMSDTTGIGISGVVYAIFGYLWAVRRDDPRVEQTLDRETIRMFVVWLFACVALTAAEILPVANAAHFFGLIFGYAAGQAFGRHDRTILLQALFAALVVAVAIPLVWCPWSITWLSQQAYKAHAAEQYETAIARYDQVINRDPESAWAYLNRSYAHEALGHAEQAADDHRVALQLNPAIEKE